LRIERLPRLGGRIALAVAFVAVVAELTNIAPRDQTLTATLRARAQQLCNPPPPGYSW